MAEGWRITRDGVLEAWVRNAPFELFVWVRDGHFEHVQLCAGADLLEWRPGYATTGSVTVRDERVGLAGLREGHLVLDRRRSAERIERLRSALSRSTLDGPLAALSAALLEGREPDEAGPVLEALHTLPVLGGG